MIQEELIELLQSIQMSRCESRTLELKSARQGCPKRLYDTLSSFSNQDDGGIIVFGVDESNNFEECGVYNPQNLQREINEQCLQMEPIVRPLLTVAEKDGKCFMAAEIPGIDLTDRPCFYKGKGRLKGSYIRSGESDAPMTEYEVYSYEAFRKKYQDDIRIVERTTFDVLDSELLNSYMKMLKSKKENLKALPDKSIYELMSITKKGNVTLSALMLFCKYPQVFFPQLCITAVVVPGTEIGELGAQGERFIDNQRIEGCLPEMLDKAMSFVRKNMKVKTVIDSSTGRRMDIAEYPIVAIREAILNSLVHRDYSVHTEGMPIQILMYNDRIEIKNPGGIYGRLTIDQLGKMQPDTRNPVIVTAMEVMEFTENRYSGIPTIRREMKEHGLYEPIFQDDRGTFIVTLRNQIVNDNEAYNTDISEIEKRLLDFLEIPRNRKEIAKYLGIRTISYAIQTYITPLIDKELVKMTIPESPRSHSQQYVRINV